MLAPLQILSDWHCFALENALQKLRFHISKAKNEINNMCVCLCVYVCGGCTHYNISYALSNLWRLNRNINGPRFIKTVPIVLFFIDVNEAALVETACLRTDGSISPRSVCVYLCVCVTMCSSMSLGWNCLAGQFNTNIFITHDLLASSRIISISQLHLFSCSPPYKLKEICSQK